MFDELAYKDSNQVLGNFLSWLGSSTSLFLTILRIFTKMVTFSIKAHLGHLMARMALSLLNYLLNMAKSRIAICLYKEEIKSFDYVKFLSGSSLTPVRLKGKSTDNFLFQRASNEKSPAWFDVLKFSLIKEDDLKTSSSGAILVLKVKKRFFACCFGTSVANINRENLVEDFDLRMFFRRMTRSTTKSVESFSFSTNPITSQRTASIPTVRDNFNIDQTSENITELEGFYKNGSSRFLIKGKEFYSCPAIDSLDEIIGLCSQLLLDYSNAVAQREFKRLTSTRKVKDKTVLEHLNNDLCAKFEKKSDKIFFCDYDNLTTKTQYKLSDSIIVDDLNIQSFPEASKRKKQ